MIDPIGELLLELNRTRPAEGLPPRPHDGPLQLQRADTLAALCAWGEARGEGRLGMLLVLCVARNRVALAPRYGVGWGGVLLKRLQFSCFNEPRILMTQFREAMNRGRGPDFEAWSVACGTAFDVIRDRAPDLTGGATNYFAPRGMVNGKPPSWTAAMTPTISYRGHLFFREE